MVKAILLIMNETYHEIRTHESGRPAPKQILSGGSAEPPAHPLSNAAFSFLMSSFFIFHISTIIASFFALFLVVFHLSKSAGAICQRTPNLSINQPHSTGLPPPAVSFFQ